MTPDSIAKKIPAPYWYSIAKNVFPNIFLAGLIECIVAAFIWFVAPLGRAQWIATLRCSQKNMKWIMTAHWMLSFIVDANNMRAIPKQIRTHPKIIRTRVTTSRTNGGIRTTCEQIQTNKKCKLIRNNVNTTNKQTTTKHKSTTNQHMRKDSCKW